MHWDDWLALVMAITVVGLPVTLLILVVDWLLTRDSEET